jgi:DNA-binding beta-propeller fold protein YncE
MLTEQLPRPLKESAKINLILMRGTSRPYFFSLILLFSGLFILFAAPASAIRIIPARIIFAISGQLNKPSDVSVSKNGLIYVVDGVNHTIKIFSGKGTLVSSFGRSGSGNGEFRSPLGIDIDDSGKVYIADSGNQRVQVFSAQGSYIAEMKIPSKNNHPADPTDVVVDDSRNRCYVVDNDNHYILAYDLSTYKLIDTYGSPGTGKRMFRFPFLIALDSENYLYIVDVINTRVQILNPDGLYVASIGGWGVEKGEFFRPKGVAIDKNNRVYVSDSYTGVIQVFESSGEFYGALGDPATGKVQKFRTPMGLFVDRNNRLYVVETLANKVSVYQLEGLAE